MGYEAVPAGKDIPNDFNVIIEIPAQSDPVDAQVLAPFPIMAGAVVRCRPIGMLKMTDEKGADAKLIVAPIDKVCPMTADIKTIDQVPQYIKDNVQHFFEQYKALEKGKWVKIEGWGGLEDAHKEITDGVANYKG